MPTKLGKIQEPKTVDPDPEGEEHVPVEDGVDDWCVACGLSVQYWNSVSKCPARVTRKTTT